MSGKKQMTIHDLDRDAGNDNEQNMYYAGGAERSGQLIIDPTRKKPDAKQIADDVFRSASSQGAQSASGDASSSSDRFAGSGYSLGAVSRPSEIVEPARQIISRSIVFWENGITVDDGPLLSYDDERNQQLIEKIKRGEVPRELLEGQPGSEPHGILKPAPVEVEVHLIDKKNEIYKPKPQQAFSGQGASLGSTSSSAAPSILASAAPSTPFFLDDSQPKTRVSIRLANGQRVTQQFNLTHTVGALYQWVAANHGSAAPNGFELVVAATRSVLTDHTASIQSAGLQEAMVMQRATS